MAGSLNRAELIGNLGKDPEIRTMNSGDRLASFSIATSETWKDKASGEKKEKTEWHNVTVWGPLVEICEKWLHKGDKVFISGKLETRKWKDKDGGGDRYSTEIVLRGFGAQMLMLSTKGDGGGQSGGSRHSRDDDRGSAGPGSSGGSGYGGGRETFSADLDDEIPF